MHTLLQRVVMTKGKGELIYFYSCGVALCLPLAQTVRAQDGQALIAQ